MSNDTKDLINAALIFIWALSTVVFVLPGIAGGNWWIIIGAGIIAIPMNILFIFAIAAEIERGRDPFGPLPPRR